MDSQRESLNLQKGLMNNMEKIRAYELSKIFGFPSKNIVNVLHEYGVSTKNHMSALSEYELDVIFEYYTQKNQAKDFSIFDKKKEEPKEAAENVSDNEDFTPVPEIEVGRKLRTVDTRVNNVDLDRIDDEKIEELIPENVKQGDKKQKINQKKKQQQRQQHSTKQKRKPENVIKKVEKKEKKVEPLNVLVPNEITVGELASRMKKSPAEIIKKLMLLGIMATVNETLDFDTASLMVEEFGGIVEKEIILTDEEILFDDFEDTAEQLKPRSPVVVVMGHVDHGKTSLLDAIRDTNVTEGEFGGITQHIGAHRVRVGEKKITFLDTPGHEAFTAMRARGALVTDIAILVVAADDGIMPQTIEAINHAKAAEVSIIVAINKIDKDGANPDKVKQELMEHGLVPEEWGGDTICVEVSAKKRQNIKELLEMVLLVAEMKELKANPDRKAKGTVIESQLDKGRGSVATVLVQNGTLHVGDYVVAGTASGRVRAMNNDKGKSVKKAGPSIPVEILGLSEVPEGGDEFYVVEDERKARSVVENRKFQEKKEKQKSATAISLDNLFEQIEAGKMKDLNIVVKADVQGSVEAVKQSLERISNDEVRVNVIHGAVGAINESDVMLASASNAIIVGFNVRPTNGASDAAEDAGVDLRMYRVIYDAIEDIEKAMKGMLDPEYEEKILGEAEVRQLFRFSKVGTIAGSYITNGIIKQDSKARLIRDGVVLYDGVIASIQREKDSVKEVKQGFECGITLEKFNDIKEKDVIEAYEMVEVKR